MRSKMKFKNEKKERGKEGKKWRKEETEERKNEVRMMFKTRLNKEEKGWGERLEKKGWEAAGAIHMTNVIVTRR